MSQVELEGRHDADLLARLRSGDEAAFEGLVARHYATMLARERDEPAVPAARFRGPDEAFPGHWRAYPGDWQASAPAIVEDRETLRVVMGAIAELPLAQRTVIRMRDIEGYSSEEVCAAL